MEDEHAQTTVKKAAIVILIKLAHEAEKKTSEELKTEIHEALEEGLARIPWIAVEKVIVIEERISDVNRAQYNEKEVKEIMPSFRCRDIGMKCVFEVAKTEDELMKKIAEHARKAHNIKIPPDFMKKLKKAIRK